MPSLLPWLRRSAAAACALVAMSAAAAGCKPKGMAEAEAARDVAWLDAEGSPQAIAALGRLADDDESARAALEKRAPVDVNVYIAAWEATLRGTAWGRDVLRAALADPLRADVAASTMARGSPALVGFVPDLENAIVRLSAGKSAVLAGLLASVGPEAHAQVERRLLDPKTRGSMCDGVGMPYASGDAKSLVLAVPASARDHASCVAVVLDMAAKEDIVIDWLATTAEPGLLSAAAKGTLPCARLAAIWKRGLVERPTEAHHALAVPLRLSVARCADALDPVLADLLARAPRARACILHGIDPFSKELGELPLACKELRGGWVAGESRRTREEISDALANGCSYGRGGATRRSR